MEHDDHRAGEARGSGLAMRATQAMTRSLRPGRRGGPRPLGEQAELVRALNAERGVPGTLGAIAELAVRAVDGCEHASVTRIVRTGPRTPAATGELPRRLDQLQYAAGDGPCLQAIARDRLCASADLAAERRWRAFSAGAVAAGVRSVLSLRLYVGEETLGSVNLYGGRPQAFALPVLPDAEAYAAMAAAALARAHAADQVDQLTRAVASNRTIGTAIGLLMGSRRMSETEAFDLLRTISQHSNRKLRDIAAELVGQGGLRA